MSFDKMVAIVGGIGVGKTYISNIFQEFGIPVFNTDNCAKEIMNNNPNIILEFCRIFGKDIYKNGKLDKIMLGNIIFFDKDKLKQLEAMVHPAVLKAFMDWKYEKIYKENYPFVMMENAILTKGKTHQLFDYAVLVDAPIKIREKRIMEREGMTEKKMKSIIKQQDTSIYVHNKLTAAGVEVIQLINNGKIDMRPKVKLCIEIFTDYFKEQ